MPALEVVVTTNVKVVVPNPHGEYGRLVGNEQEQLKTGIQIVF